MADAGRGPITFQGRELDHNFVVELTNNAFRQRHFSRYRIQLAQGIRRKTTVVTLRKSWVQRHPDAADWVVKVLPERRTLERDLIAGAGSVEPVISRVAMGDLDRDSDYAEACENYLETWKRENVPHQTHVEKAAEDGEFGVTVVPTSVDMDGCEDFYDRLDQRAWDALDDEQKAEYQPDQDKPGRYTRMGADGKRAYNPKFDRDAKGKPKQPYAKDFKRDDDKSKEAHDKAVQRYLLKQEQGGVTCRVIPALDCAPYLTRGTKRERWKPIAICEKTLYYPEELIQAGYNCPLLGDAALIPQGHDPTRSTGQNGMFYLYTIYLLHRGEDRIERTIIIRSVAGRPTSYRDPRKGEENLAGGVTLTDLYEQFGLVGRYFAYFGGMHTSDDDPDFYWEPALWPVYETMLGIEGMITMVNAATAVNATGGHFHKPDAALVGGDGVDPDAFIESATGELRKPVIPESGEIETVTGDVFPAQLATVTSDAWRVIANELQSLRDNMSLRPPTDAGASGHAMVVGETLGQMMQRHIREGALDATKFCVESALKIFHALSLTYGVNWPIQTTKERPVGSELRSQADVLEFNPEWVGDGEYSVGCTYPEEGNLAKVEQAASMAERGFGSPEDIWAAEGKSDPETEWAKVLKWKIRNHPAYVEAQVTRLAKRQGNRLMLQVQKLQSQGQMTQQGAPGFESGIPASALRGPGGGGPTTAQQSRAGAISGEVGTAARTADAEAQLQVSQGAA